MVKIIFYRDKCIGCHACVEAHRGRWRMSRKDGKSVLIDSKQKKHIYSVDVGDHELEDNVKAAANCPVNIIRIHQ